MPAPSTPVRFDTLLAALSSRFVNLPPGDVDGAIDDALRRICEPLGVDFAALWEWSADESRILTLTHCYVTEGGPPAASHQREEHFPWVSQQVQAGITVALSSLEELPPEAAVDRASGERLRIKSALGVPLSVGGSPPTGILGFNTVRAPRVWSDEIVEQLRLVAQVFANALARRRHDLSLRKSEARLALAADAAEAGIWTLNLGYRRLLGDGAGSDALRVFARRNARRGALRGIGPSRRLGRGPGSTRAGRADRRTLRGGVPNRPRGRWPPAVDLLPWRAPRQARADIEPPGGRVDRHHRSEGHRGGASRGPGSAAGGCRACGPRVLRGGLRLARRVLR